MTKNFKILDYSSIGKSEEIKNGGVRIEFANGIVFDVVPSTDNATSALDVRLVRGFPVRGEQISIEPRCSNVVVIKAQHDW